MTTEVDSKQDIAALVGRVLLAAIFVISGYGKIGNFAGITGYIASKGLPMPSVLAGLTVVLEIVGGLLILSGWKSRWVALVFFVWLIPTTLIFHAFWAVPPEQFASMQVQFLKNLSIMGGMLLLAAYGPGRYSVGAAR